MRFASQPNSFYRRTGDGEDWGVWRCIHCGWEVHAPRFNCCCWDVAMWMFADADLAKTRPGGASVAHHSTKGAENA